MAEPASPWAPLISLRREMDCLCHEFGAARWPVPSALRLMAEMTAELPGIETGDTDLEVSGDMVTLRNETGERTAKGRNGSERRSGSFQRTVRLPDVDVGMNGTLTVTFLQRERAKSREQRIEISGG